MDVIERLFASGMPSVALKVGPDIVTLRPGAVPDAVSDAISKLGPCTCARGDPRLSALAPKLYWCICEPDKCLLAAFEAAVRSQGTWPDYGLVCVKIRSLF